MWEDLFVVVSVRSKASLKPGYATRASPSIFKRHWLALQMALAPASYPINSYRG
jgi:hypothetical protein